MQSQCRGGTLFPDSQQITVTESPTPTKSPQKNPNGKDDLSNDQNDGVGDQVKNSEISLDNDPGESQTYQNGEFGVRIYYLPDGIRVTAVFTCVRNTPLPVRISGVGYESNHSLCNGVVGAGSRQGVSFFYPANCDSFSPFLTVTLEGTNIDGTSSYPVPESLRTPCNTNVTPQEPVVPVPSVNPNPESEPVQTPTTHPDPSATP